MTITITGPKGTAEPCKQEIMALINDPYPPGPGAHIVTAGRAQKICSAGLELCLLQRGFLVLCVCCL
jgi:hypothetical protein